MSRMFISRAWLERRSTSSAKAGLASRTRPLKSKSTMPSGVVENAAVRQSVAGARAGERSSMAGIPVAVCSVPPALGCGVSSVASAIASSQVDRGLLGGDTGDFRRRAPESEEGF